MKYHLRLDADMNRPLPTLVLDLVQEEGVLQNMMQVFAGIKVRSQLVHSLLLMKKRCWWWGQSTRRTGKQRPMVARLKGSQILEVIDLSTSPQREIQRVEGLSGYEHRLEDLELG